MDEAKRKSNLKTAWTIAAVALFFFLIGFVKRIWF